MTLTIMPPPALSLIAPLDRSSTLAPAALIGCAGWSVPKISAEHFPVDGSHLERYARTFGCVEINSAFYRSHRPATYARWAASTPPSFRFSVKVPKQITHEGRLREPGLLLERYAGEVTALGDKLGCILTQLPPSLAFDEAVAELYFAALRQHVGCMLACEARHPSWFGAPATALLTAHGVTRVIADPAAGQPGPHEPTSADLYVRLHGSPRVYYATYADDYLRGLGMAIAAHVKAGRQVWCIFDNTLSPTFADQALLVQECARELSAGSPGSLRSPLR